MRAGDQSDRAAPSPELCPEARDRLINIGFSENVEVLWQAAVILVPGLVHDAEHMGRASGLTPRRFVGSTRPSVPRQTICSSSSWPALASGINSDELTIRLDDQRGIAWLLVPRVPPVNRRLTTAPLVLVRRTNGRDIIIF